jgi:hypothetical protein
MNLENKNKYAVITTINEYGSTFIENFQNKGYSAVIVGDKKTPHNSYLDKDLLYIHPDEKSKFTKFTNRLPYNHYCRKNIGYLYAEEQGPGTILDTDDDNFLTQDIKDWDKLNLKNVIGPDLPNILNEFSDVKIWARGYPLEYVNKHQNITTTGCSDKDINSVGIIQSLVNGDADVDAIYRLTSPNYSNNFKFKEGKGFIFNRDIFSQGNTQSTLWVDPRLFHLLYIPTTVSFRFCDILKMYVAQRCMWEYDSRLTITSPFFYQERNAHDYMKDFNSEVSMYECLQQLLEEILPNIRLQGDKDDIIRVYEALEKKQITGPDELETLKRFVELS